MNSVVLGRPDSVTQILPEDAWRIAEQALAESLPGRWAHSQGVARQVYQLARVLGPDASLLASAAVLHDVGYAPSWPPPASTRWTAPGIYGTCTGRMTG